MEPANRSRARIFSDDVSSFMRPVLIGTASSGSCMLTKRRPFRRTTSGAAAADLLRPCVISEIGTLHA